MRRLVDVVGEKDYQALSDQCVYLNLDFTSDYAKRKGLHSVCLWLALVIFRPRSRSVDPAGREGLQASLAREGP